MDIEVCAQCGNEVEGKGVKFRGRVFCSDACCDEFEEELSAQDELDLEDLDDLDENELMSRSDGDLDDFDDDFAIDDDDF